MNALRWMLAALLAANGLFMLVSPQAWYDGVPGVTSTGPLNFHFVRDIGCAYLVSGIGLVWRVVQPSRGGSAAILGALFLLLHAGVHIGETLLGICGSDALLRDVPGVVVPALLAFVLALPPRTHPLTHPRRIDHAL